MTIHVIVNGAEGLRSVVRRMLLGGFSSMTTLGEVWSPGTTSLGAKWSAAI